MCMAINEKIPIFVKTVSSTVLSENNFECEICGNIHDEESFCVWLKQFADSTKRNWILRSSVSHEKSLYVFSRNYVCQNSSFNKNSKVANMVTIDNGKVVYDLYCDLSSKKITCIPKNITLSESLQSLSLNFNYLEKLPSSLFTKLPNLTYLACSGCHLIHLPENIGDLRNLKELWIEENNLTSLPQSIGELRKLEEFNANANHLSSLPEEFTNLSSLKKLSVNENELKYLPERFGDLEQLTSFDACHNKIEQLPQSFGCLKKLSVLCLSDNYLKGLPESFQHLELLILLNLASNKITSLPDSLASARSLEKLYFDNNQISYLPPWFEEMANLKTLYLTENLLIGSPFPDNFGIVSPQLHDLRIDGNQIKSLPNSFSHLTSLQCFDMGSPLYELERNRALSNGNLLNFLPSNFGNLSCLTDLHLDENKIYELPEDFGALSKLKALNLSHNNLKSIPESFCNLQLLTNCLLSMNYLEHLPNDFGNLVKLQELKLDNNVLTEIPSSMEKLVNLCVFDLYQNKLTKLPNFLNKLTKVKYLSLRENDFNIPIEELPEIFPIRDPLLQSKKHLFLPPSPIAIQLQQSVRPLRGYNLNKFEESQIKCSLMKARCCIHCATTAAKDCSDVPQKSNIPNGYYSSSAQSTDSDSISCEMTDYTDSDDASDESSYKHQLDNDDEESDNYLSEENERDDYYNVAPCVKITKPVDEEVWEIDDDVSNPYSYFVDKWEDASVEESASAMLASEKKDEIIYTLTPDYFPPKVFPPVQWTCGGEPGQFDDADP